MAAPAQDKPSVPVKVEQRPTRMRDMFDAMDEIQRELARVWSDVAPIFPRPFGRPFARGFRAVEPWTPRMDLYERNGDLVITAELPGVNREDIHLTLRERGITIEGERRSATEVKEEDYYHSERIYGRFYRYIPFDFEPDADKLKAAFKDGVLEIIIPKPQQPKASERTIPIAA